MADWENRRIELLLEQQLIQLQLLNRRLWDVEKLVCQLVEAEAAPTFNGTVGATVRITP